MKTAKPAPMTAHLYKGDGRPDQFGADRCVECRRGRNQGRAKDAHDAGEAAAAEEREVSARIVGEGGEE